ncbi:MAG TPA: DoxX family protein [Gemmatimonadaceae bacterium]|nr:DoxX family protein [Gemmatimonadaceae bacterium]
MRLLPPVSQRQTDLGLLILRVIAGVIFAAHGAQKLFVYGLGGVSGSFAQMGIPMGELVGPLVAFLEFFGGLALIAGLLTRYVGLGLAGVMLGATLLVHLPAGFFAPNGIEFTLALFGIVLMFVLTGPGALSADAMLGRRTAGATRPAEAARVRRAA